MTKYWWIGLPIMILVLLASQNFRGAALAAVDVHSDRKHPLTDALMVIDVQNVNYPGLRMLLEKYGGSSGKFDVLAFPCNQFGGQVCAAPQVYSRVLCNVQVMSTYMRHRTQQLQACLQAPLGSEGERAYAYKKFGLDTFPVFVSPLPCY